MKNYSGFQTKLITKRTAYVLSTDILAREFNIADKDFPMYIGQVNVFKKDVIEYYWFYQDESGWKKYLEFYADKMDTFRPAIKAIVDEVISKIRAVESADNVDEDDFEFYVPRMAKVMRFSAILRCIDIAIFPKLKEFLSEDEIAIAAILKEETVVGKEERMILELASEGGLNAEEKESKLREIYDETKWIYYGLHNEQPVSFEEYKKQFFAITNPAQKLSEAERRKTEDVQKCDALVARLTTEQKKLVEIAQQLAFLKDYNKLGMDVCFALFQACAEKISHKTGITEENIRLLLCSEVRDLLKGKAFDFAEIKKRNELMAFVGHPDSWEVLVGDEVTAFEQKYVKKILSGVMKGRVASRGIAKGIARVITKRDDFKKMQKGDILVVTNTTPDYVPIMKLASAIVAEEGGITAHVSVVSREFGIPCIVGIAHITEILKDGDVVEVDAEKGVVKKV